MPVRFRCKHCQQLLGIARRKIGTEVRCPECHKMVLVPGDDAPNVEETARKRDYLFEGGAKEQPLPPSLVDPAVDPPRPAPMLSPAPVESFDAELYAIPDPARNGGVFLSPLHTLLLTVAAVVIFLLVFVIGLLVGRYVL